MIRMLRRKDPCLQMSISLSCTRGNQNQTWLSARPGQAPEKGLSPLQPLAWLLGEPGRLGRPASLEEGGVGTGLQFEKPVRCSLPFLSLLGCQNIYLTS